MSMLIYAHNAKKIAFCMVSCTALVFSVFKKKFSLTPSGLFSCATNTVICVCVVFTNSTT